MRDNLKAKYQTLRNISHVLSDVEMHVEHASIKTCLVNRIDARENELQFAAAQACLDDIDITNSIDIEKIFDATTEGKECKKVLIYGKPGVGKSTLCQLLSVKWQEDKLWAQEFASVIWISLRELSYDEQEDEVFSYIASVIIKHCFLHSSSEPQKIAELAAHILNQDNRANMLFILDGYDEIAERLSPNIKKMLTFLIDDPHCSILITSRHIAIELNGKRPAFDRTLENLGFKKDNIKEYISRFHKADESNLTQLFHTNKAAADIARIPLLLELVCNIYIDNQKSVKTISLSEMYGKVSKLMLSYYGNRQSAPTTKEKEAVLISLLEDIAFSAMMERTSLIAPERIITLIKPYQEQFQDKSLFLELIDLGLIKTIRKNKSDLENHVYFIHQTLQEYFAASKLAKGFLSYRDSKELKDAENFLQQYKYTPYYKEVWVHVVNIIYLDCKLHNDYMLFAQFWDLFENGKKDLLGLAHEQLRASLLSDLNIQDDMPQSLRALYNKLIDSKAVVQKVIKIIKEDKDEIHVIRAIDALVALNDTSTEVATVISNAKSGSQFDDVKLFAEEALLRLGVNEIDMTKLRLIEIIDGIVDPNVFIKKSNLDEYKILSYAREEYALRACSRIKVNSDAFVPKLITIYNALSGAQEKIKEHISKNFGEFNEVSSILKLTMAETIASITQGKNLELIIECYGDLEHNNASVKNFAYATFSRLKTHKAIYQTLSSKYKEVLEHNITEIDHIAILLAERTKYMTEHARNAVNRGFWGYAFMPGLGVSLGLGVFFIPTMATVLGAFALQSYIANLMSIAVLQTTSTSVGVVASIMPVSAELCAGIYGLHKTARIYNGIYECIGNYFAQKSAAQILDEMLHKNPKDLLKQIACFVGSDGSKVTNWAQTGTLDLPLAIEMYSYYCTSKVPNPEIWLAPMHNIVFIYKNPSALLLLTSDYIEYNGRKITKTKAETKEVLKAMKTGFSNEEMPTSLLDRYIAGNKLYLTTAAERAALSKRYKSPRKLALTELHKAAASGKLEDVKRIVGEGKIDINDFQNDAWETPLVVAIKHKHWNIVQYLVEKDADVNLGGAIISILDKRQDAPITMASLLERAVQNSVQINPKLIEKALQAATEDYLMQKGSISGKNLVLNLLIQLFIGSSEPRSDYDKYRFYLGNIGSIHRDGIGQMNIMGNCPDETLMVRLKTLLVLYIKVNANEILTIPRLHEDIVMSVVEVQNRLLEEIIVLAQSTSFANIVHRLKLMVCFESQHKSLGKKLERILAQSIVPVVQRMERDTEYIIASEYQEHCIYVSFRKSTNDTVIIRVDSRFIHGDGDKMHMESPYVIHGVSNYNTRSKQIKSFFVREIDPASDQQFLHSYIMNLFTQQAMEKRLDHIYSHAVKYSSLSLDLQGEVAAWPYHIIQSTTTHNCTLSSYNLGISCRQGMKFFEWLIGKEQSVIPPLKSINRVQDNGI
ncbi:MAG: NACHT domain-containing protein [Alphaproteobacteria bacterium]|jgi:ankyrin repeat protein/energy-coupling factor transporter ATP-binding protein EcfA2